ncbi:MAG: hypothetical protein RL033_7430 [Pseudomonadota bacterium]
MAESPQAIYRPRRMDASNEDVEGLLTGLQRHFEQAGNGVYLIGMGAGLPSCALSISPPVLVAQVHVGLLPRLSEGATARYLRRLLELNASGLLHAAFALEGDQIVLTAALELQNLDANELAAVLADLDMALGEHVPGLVALSHSLGG